MSLEMGKSLATTAVLAMAIAQAVLMGQVRGYIPMPPIELEKRDLRRLHRWGGIATLLLTLTVALICTCAEGYVLYSPRVKAHAAMGTLAALLMALKVAITHRFRRYVRFNTALGITAGLLILGTFAASALWYLVQEFD